MTERLKAKRGVFEDVGGAFSGAKPHCQAESGTPRPDWGIERSFGAGEGRRRQQQSGMDWRLRSAVAKIPVQG